MSGGTTSTILSNLEPDKVYSVAVVPVYPDVEGIREQEKGKTSESPLPSLPGSPDLPSPAPGFITTKWTGSTGCRAADSLEPSAEEHVSLVPDGSKNAMRLRPAQLHLEVQLHFQFPT